MRSASPARGLGRRRGSGGGNAVGSQDGSRGQGSELATVRSIRMPPGTLRRSTPNLSVGGGQSYGRTDGPASQTAVQTSQASLTNGRASHASSQTRNQSRLASQNNAWANNTNSPTAYHKSRAASQASRTSSPADSRSPDKTAQSASAGQLAPSGRHSSASPSTPVTSPLSTGLGGSHQDPRTKVRVRAMWENWLRTEGVASTGSNPAARRPDPARPLS